MRVVNALNNISNCHGNRATCQSFISPLRGLSQISPASPQIYLPASIRAAISPTAAYRNSLDLASASSLLHAAPEHDEAGSLDADTIVAVVTGAQQGAVSIIRLSGWDAVPTAASVFSPSGTYPDGWVPETHRIYYGHAIDSRNAVIDEVLVLVMLGPRSFTAEDVVEIHTHGGGICAQRVVQACLSAGARLAKPGEFTLRAFLNGRLDLSQAESVAALVEARTVAAADSALAGLQGGLGKEIQISRRECIDLLVEMDARLDFDEDLPPIDIDDVIKRIRNVAGKVAAALATSRQGQLLRTGLQVALVGRPNVGKSSLLNALSGTERAIVTEIAGTTRDVVDVGVVVGGIPVTLLDTAGLRNAEDKVERIGVERSVAAARAADVVVMVVDGGDGWTPEDDEIFEMLRSSRNEDGTTDNSTSNSILESTENNGTHECDGSSKMPPSLLVVNKAELSKADLSISTTTTQENASPSLEEEFVALSLPSHVQHAFSATVYTSATTGMGLDILRSELLELAGTPELTPGGVAWAVNERQAEALTRASEALIRVESSVVSDLPIDFWTIDLRSAVLALGEVSGEDVTEEVLDAVFSRFCIGK